MKTFLLFSIFAIATANIAQAADSLTNGSPEWIVTTFFTNKVMPQTDKYYTGEMLHYRQTPPMGAYMPPGYKFHLATLSNSEASRIYRFTYLQSSQTNDWYAFLRREEGLWKLSAVRVLAIPAFVSDIRNDLRKRAARSPKEDLQLENMDLMFSSDSELHRYFLKNHAAFAALATRVLKGESNSAMKAALDELHVDRGDLSPDGLVEITIGGVLDNSVGFLFVPEGKKAPLMDANNFILIDPIQDGWFLFKTT